MNLDPQTRMQLTIDHPVEIEVGRMTADEDFTVGTAMPPEFVMGEAEAAYAEGRASAAAVALGYAGRMNRLRIESEMVR